VQNVQGTVFAGEHERVADDEQVTEVFSLPSGGWCLACLVCRLQTARPTGYCASIALSSNSSNQCFAVQVRFTLAASSASEADALIKLLSQVRARKCVHVRKNRTIL